MEEVINLPDLRFRGRFSQPSQGHFTSNFIMTLFTTGLIVSSHESLGALTWVSDKPSISENLFFKMLDLLF